MWLFVSGFPRSGTSFMVAAMNAGGLPLLHCPRREAWLREAARQASGPRSNDSYLEMSEEQKALVLRGAAGEGHIMKLQPPGPSQLRDGLPHRIIFMSREEGLSVKSMALHFKKKNFRAQRNGKTIDDLLNDSRQKNGCISAHVVHFDEVTQNPLPVFEFLRSEGWPIEPAKAAAIVDRSRVNFGPNAYYSKNSLLLGGPGAL